MRVEHVRDQFRLRDHHDQQMLIAELAEEAFVGVQHRGQEVRLAPRGTLRVGLLHLLVGAVDVFEPVVAVISPRDTVPGGDESAAEFLPVVGVFHGELEREGRAGPFPALGQDAVGVAHDLVVRTVFLDGLGKTEGRIDPEHVPDVHLEIVVGVDVRRESFRFPPCTGFRPGGVGLADAVRDLAPQEQMDAFPGVHFISIRKCQQVNGVCALPRPPEGARVPGQSRRRSGRHIDLAAHAA